MCKRKFVLPKSTIPGRRWQYVCLKDSESLRGYKGTGSCSLFCSPDSREFQTLAQVRKHQRKLEVLSSEKKKLKLLEERREKEILLRASLLTKKPKLTESKPTIPLVLKNQKAENISTTKTEKNTKITKAKEKITTKQIQYFCGMKEYPIIVNPRNQKLWEDIAIFRKYYIPLVYTANPTIHIRLLETYMEAKWREIMAWKL